MNTRHPVVLHIQRMGMRRPKPPFIETAARGFWASALACTDDKEAQANLPLSGEGLEMPMAIYTHAVDMEFEFAPLDNPHTPSKQPSEDAFDSVDGYAFDGVGGAAFF